MKTTTKRIYLISLIILLGLILALPFTDLRKSLGTSINTATETVYEKVGVKDFKNKQIAQVITNTLQINEIGDFRNVNLANGGSNITNNENEAPINYVMSSQKMQTSDFGVHKNNRVGSGNSSQANSDIAFSNSSVTQNPNLTARSTNNSAAIAMSSTANAANSKTAIKQSAGNGPPPDNGGENPPPIGSLPLSDGTFFMLLLCVLFVLKKTNKISVV